MDGGVAVADLLRADVSEIRRQIVELHAFSDTQVPYPFHIRDDEAIDGFVVFVLEIVASFGAYEIPCLILVHRPYVGNVGKGREKAQTHIVCKPCKRNLTFFLCQDAYLCPEIKRQPGEVKEFYSLKLLKNGFVGLHRTRMTYMENEKDYAQEVLRLVYRGYYNIVQQLNGGDEEPYEGCVHNLFMILEDGEAKVSLLDESDPRARKGCKTYTVEYSIYAGEATLIIWEV